jgi:uncharacterized surface protein with fasciclin (FAS1) repeats
LKSDENLSSLGGLLADNGLDKALNNASQPQFVFAPTNEAIDNLKTALGPNADAVLANKTLMGDVSTL